MLVDLGIAKAHIPGGNQTGTFARKAGTEGYAPPEQYTASGQTGPWSDVYALGATLYQLLTGRVPPTAIERVTLDTALIPPSQVNPAISGWVSAALMRALALRPTERFQSVQAFAISSGGPHRQNRHHAAQPVVDPTAFPLATPPMQSSLGVPTPPSMGPVLARFVWCSSIPNTSLDATRSHNEPTGRQSSSRARKERDRQMPLQLQTKVNAGVSAAARKESEVTGRRYAGFEDRRDEGAKAVASTLGLVLGNCRLCRLAGRGDCRRVYLQCLGSPRSLQPQSDCYRILCRAGGGELHAGLAILRRYDYRRHIPGQFIASLAQDDAQLGRVQQADVNHMTIENDSSGTTTVQVNVARAQSPSVSNTLILGLYNGSLWLINSITTP